MGGWIARLGETSTVACIQHVLINAHIGVDRVQWVKGSHNTNALTVANIKF